MLTMLNSLSIKVYIKSLIVHYFLKGLENISSKATSKEDAEAMIMLSNAINKIVDKTDDIAFIHDSKSCQHPPNKS